MGAQILGHGFTRKRRVLAGHKAHGKLGMRQGGNDSLATRTGIAAPHAIHIKRRAQPKPFQEIRRHKMARRDPNGSIMLRHIEGNARQFRALFGRSCAGAGPKAFHRNLPIRIMQCRDQACHGMQRVRCDTAITAGMQILGRATERDFHAGIAARAHRHCRQIRPPARAICGQHRICSKQSPMARQQGAERR